MPNSINLQDARNIVAGWGFTENLFDQYLLIREMIRKRGFVSNAELKGYLRELHNLNFVNDISITFRYISQLLRLSGDVYQVRSGGHKGLACTSLRCLAVSLENYLYLSPLERDRLVNIPMNAEGEIDIVHCIANSAKYIQTPPQNMLISEDPLDLLPDLSWVRWWGENRGIDVHPKTAGPSALWEAITTNVRPSQLQLTEHWSLQHLNPYLDWDNRRIAFEEGQVVNHMADQAMLGSITHDHGGVRYYACYNMNSHQMGSAGEARMALISRGASCGQPEVMRRLGGGGYQQTAPFPLELRAALALVWNTPNGWYWSPQPDRVEIGEGLLTAVGISIIDD